jgi:hypothetical protein
MRPAPRGDTPLLANAVGYLTSVLLRSLEHGPVEPGVSSQLCAKRLYFPEWRKKVIEKIQREEQEAMKESALGIDEESHDST